MTAKWFENVGNCINCGKSAHGHLMNERNEQMGAYCRPCSVKKIEFDKEASTVRRALLR